jgi:hypothetical protein
MTSGKKLEKKPIPMSYVLHWLDFKFWRFSLHIHTHVHTIKVKACKKDYSKLSVVRMYVRMYVTLKLTSCAEAFACLDSTPLSLPAFSAFSSCRKLSCANEIHHLRSHVTHYSDHMIVMRVHYNTTRPAFFPSALLE